MAPSIRFCLYASFVSILSSCAQIGFGTEGSPNDPIPSGTIVAQGSFSGLNGRTVTGTATVYETGSGTYVVRLGGIVTPEESGLQMIGVVNGSSLSPTSLRATSGSQNYTITLSGSASWDQIRIHSAPNNLDYGQALLD